MNKHLKCVIKLSITLVLFFPFLFLVFVPTILIGGLLAMSGCTDSWMDDPLFCRIIDWWRDL